MITKTCPVTEISDIKGFINTSFLDWRGKISSIIFLANCNFRCPYCHNKDLVLCPQKIANIPLNKLEDKLRENADWIDGVVISGGEPTLHPQLKSLIKKIRNLGYKIKLDTNGSKPAVLHELIEEKLIDYIAMDFKAPLAADLYARCSGINMMDMMDMISAIRCSILLLMKEKIEYEFRVTIYPGVLKKEHILAMAKEIKGARKFILQNFRPGLTLDPKLEKLEPCKKDDLNDMKNLIAPFVRECMVISS